MGPPAHVIPRDIYFTTKQIEPWARGYESIIFVEEKLFQIAI